MPTAGNVTSEALDVTGVRLVPYFEVNGELTTWPKAEAEEVVLQAGAEPSFASVRVPLAALDERAPAVAGIQGGPLHSIREGQRAEVHAILPDSTSWIVLRGSVVRAGHQFGDRADLGTVKILDDRWLLKGVPIPGSWWSVSNASSSSFAYRQGWPAHTNKQGLPNAVWNGEAGCHLFCEPNMGITDTIPSGADMDAQRACYWEPWMWFAYLRFAFDAAQVATAQAYFAWYPSAPAELVWPDGLGNALYHEGANRKLPEHNHDGANLLDDMLEALKSEGEHDLFVEPGVYGTLAIVRGKYTGAGAASILRSSSVSDLGSPQIVIGGELEENAEDLYTQIAAAGALTFIERRVSTTGVGFVTAWTTADYNSFTTALHDYLTSGSGAAGREMAEPLEKAFKAYPDVCAAWKVDPTYDFQTGTAEAGMSLAAVNRPVGAHLLSSYFDSTQTAMRGRSQYRRPVLFSSLISGGSWHVCTWGDGFTISEDGKIWLPGLREKATAPGNASAGNIYRADAFIMQTSGASGTSGLISFTPASLRATLAIPCDHRLNVARRLPVAEGDVGLPCLPSGGDEDRIESGLARQAYIRPGLDVDSGGGLAGKELRRDAYPVPEEVLGAAQESTIRDDSDELAAHVEQRAVEYCRLRRGGTLVIPHIAAAWSVGQCVSQLEWSGGAYPVKACLWRVALKNDYTEKGRSQRAVLSLR